MIRNQLTVIFRLLSKRKFSSLIILFSIGIAISISTLLYTFVQRETGSDRFHSGWNSVYRLLSNDPFADNGKTLSYIQSETSDYVSSNYPEISGSARSRICQGTV